MGVVVGIVAGYYSIRDSWQQRPEHDLTGEWLVVNTFDETAYNKYKGMALGYSLFITQDGGRIKCHGEKTTENGVELVGKARVAVEGHGTYADGTVRITFIERGLRRTSNGSFVLTVVDDGRSATGGFSTTVANSKGTSRWTKVE